MSKTYGVFGTPNSKKGVRLIKGWDLIVTFFLAGLAVSQFFSLLTDIAFRSSRESTSVNKPAQNPLGKLLPKGHMEIDFEMVDSRAFTFYVTIRGIVPENEKYGVRLKHPEREVGVVIADITRHDTVLNNGCKFDRQIGVDGEYVATIEDYKTGVVIATKKTFLSRGRKNPAP